MRRLLFGKMLAALPVLAVAFCGLTGQAQNNCADCHCASEPPVTTPISPAPLAPTPLPRVHDPVMAKEAGIYYLFCTGRGITLYTSKDRTLWQRKGRVFTDPMPWTASAIPGSTENYWAPEISFFNNKWHLYYSVSTFGKNRSAIGLATNVTLNPDRPDYQWKDEGPVVESKPEDDWNAIDPNLVLDANAKPWLSFGSFWGGIKLVKLDPFTGKPVKTPELYSVASRPRTAGAAGAIEAPFIVRHGAFYYLFVSFDFCCKGVDSTYNIRVGRASKITGPYLDRDNKPMTEGGGTLVRAGSERWRGPGHCAVLHENNRDWLVYHAYDAEDNGASKLRMEEITWNSGGWPTVPKP